MASATKTASKTVEGRLLRKVGGAGPSAGSQSMLKPPDRTERVSAQIMPIASASVCMVDAQYYGMAGAHTSWARGGSVLTFCMFARHVSAPVED
jgi:hypothetical protein